MLLQVFYGARSERMLMEQTRYNLLCRWFIGLAIEDAVWVPTVFSRPCKIQIAIAPTNGKCRLRTGEALAGIDRRVISPIALQRTVSVTHGHRFKGAKSPFRPKRSIARINHRML